MLISVSPSATTTYSITSVKDVNNSIGTGNAGSAIVTVLANIINTTTIVAVNTYTWTNNGQTYTTSGTYTGTTTGHTVEQLNLTITHISARNPIRMTILFC